MVHALRHGDRSRSWAVLAAIALAIAMLAGAVGCTSPAAEDTGGAAAEESATFPVTITDDSAREVTVDSRPEKVVSLAPANTEIVAALGALDRLVGVTTFCNYPPEVADLPKVGDFAQPNVEAIVAADPDVIFATSGVQADVVAKLEEAGAVVVVIDPLTLDGLYDSITDAAAVLGEPAAGEELVEGMRADIESIRTAVAAEEPVTAFVEIAQDPLFTTGPGTLMAELLEAAGGTNVVTEEGWVAYSLEQLVADDPDVYMATKGSMSDPSALDSRPGYADLTCVKNGRVAVLDDDLVSRPGPRVVDGVREMATALHPDVTTE